MFVNRKHKFEKKIKKTLQDDENYLFLTKEKVDKQKWVLYTLNIIKRGVVNSDCSHPRAVFVFGLNFVMRVWYNHPDKINDAVNKITMEIS